MTFAVEAPTRDPQILEELAPLWVEMQEHQIEVASYEGTNRDLDGGWAHRRREYAELLDSGGAILVVRIDGAIAGYCAVRLTTGGDSTWTTTGIAHVNTLAVRPGWRGRGIGSALIDAASAFATEADADILELEVMPGNDEARRLYERLEFEPVEVVMHRRLR